MVLVVACAVAWALVTSSLQPLAMAAEPTPAAKSAKEAADSDGDGRPDGPDAGSAAVAARKLRTPVEDLSQRTPTRQVFINPDGTWTRKLSAAPVRARDPKTGTWGPIDTTLVEREEGWRPANAVGELSFSDGGGEPLARMTDETGREVAWSWPTVLPAPTVEGSTLTYPDVVPNGDLVVQALPDGFSHSVVLRAAPEGPLRLPMLVEADGAKLTRGRHGSLTLTTGDGEPVVSAPAPLMWDATVDRGARTDGNNEAGASRPRRVDVAVRGSGKGTRVVLKPDAAFLADPGTAYPVTIDPTYTLGPAGGYAGLNPSDIDYDFYTVGRFPSGEAGRLLVDFDEATSAGETITAASLSLPVEYSSDCATHTIAVQRLTSAWSPEAVTWASQPSASTANAAVTVQPASAGVGCATQRSDSWDITAIAQAWAGGATNDGLRVVAADETAAQLREYDPAAAVLSITGSGAPLAATVPMPSDSQTWAGQWYTRTATPEWTTSAVDPDLTTVRYRVEVHDSTDPTSTAAASCTTGYVASGAPDSCTPSEALPNGTYYVRARGEDGTLAGAWSRWHTTTINSTVPAAVDLTCPGTADQHWYGTRPAASMTCTATSTGAVQLEWKLNGATQSVLSANQQGAATTPAIAIPASGWTSVEVRGVSNAGLATTWTEYAFGTGQGWLISPTPGATSATTFEIEAAGASGATSAVLQWRAGSTDTWKVATELFTADHQAWDGHVNDNGSMSTLPAVTWRPAAEAGMTIPGAIEVRVVFSDGTYTTPTQTSLVTIAAHAAGNAAPTVSVGPGSVQLGSGEFQTGAVDAAAGALAISRTHLSNAAPETGAAGVFGPGWAASLDGGAAALTVADQRATNSSILFTAPDGTVYTYRSSEPAATNVSGEFAATGDARALGATVDLDRDSGKLTYTETGGTVTTFERTAGRWLPTSTVGAAAESTTSYYYGSNGLPSWIIAPAPTGLTCTPASLPAGCQALQLTYTTVNGAARVTRIDHHAWDPKLTDADGDAGNDGLPDAGAAVVATAVAKYAYNTDGTLQSVWDPRAGDGAAALKTSYGYATSAGLTRVTSVTPPGEKTWQINYDSTGAVATITRQLDPAVGSGNATWTVKYGLKLNAEGDGLPNMSSAKTAAWGQRAADAPDTGAAVFGPDKVPATQPTADDFTYATLYYWNTAGRLTNTATYGGKWQISTTRYDAMGNEIWSITPEIKAQILNSPVPPEVSAATADNYATWTLYNAEGTRVEAQYGPIVHATTKSGMRQGLRSLTQYLYDDEVDASLVPGRPTTDVPEGGYGLVVETRSSATDERIPGTWSITQAPGQADTPPPVGVSVYDTTKTRYRYDTAITGSVNGWGLYQATAVLQQNGAGWDTTSYGYNAAGGLIAEITPEGVATGQATRRHNTVYYTADASASRNECDNKPQWAALPCWEGPHAQPTDGSHLPAISHTGYSRDLAPTRQVTQSGTATKTVVAGYDAAGRSTRSSISSTGVTGATITTTTGYSTTNGQPTTVSNGTATMTTSYDSWGRVTSQTDGAGNTATTSYDTAGNVATHNDGKGTYTYGYDQTIDGKIERRGMVTTLDVGISGVIPLEGSYDNDGHLIEQRYGAPVYGTRNGLSWGYDIAGNLMNRAAASGLAYVASVREFDVNGRTTRTRGYGTGMVLNRTETYTYDDRGRLRAVADDGPGAADCTTRTYTLTADSNRTSLTTYGPDANGNCQSSTGGNATTSTYDAADRITTTGYAYDALGRTTTLPAAHTTNPSGGALTATYQVNDMVKTLTQGSTTQTYTLDPLGRISTKTQTVNGVDVAVTTNHYADTTDNPAWSEFKTRPNATTAWTTAWTRYARGIDGTLAITQASGQTPMAAEYDINGNIIGHFAIGSAIQPSATASYTEFGALKSGSTNPGRYGWLGAAQRDTDTPGGLTLMGVRLYNPTTGRFLSRDPIRGGNDNTYIYPADPINGSDTSGALCLSKNCLISKGIDAAMGAIAGGAGLGCGAGAGPVGVAICAGIVGGATASLGYWLKYKFAGGSFTTSGNRAAIRKAFTVAGLTKLIAGTAPASGLHKAAYSVKQKIWNLIAKLAKIPYVGGKMVSAAQSALGWIFAAVEDAIQAL